MDARGPLIFAQQDDHVPFPIKRFFVIHHVAPGGTRGAHAHRAQHQFLVMLAGKAAVTVDDGIIRSRIVLDRATQALYAPPLLWLELSDFSPDAVCMVLASGAYSESDYIRDRAEFLRLAG